MIGSPIAASVAGPPAGHRPGSVRRALVILGWAGTLAGAAGLLLLGLGFGVALGSISEVAAMLVPLAFATTVYGSVGAVLAWRRPENAIGAVLMLGGVLIATTFGGYVLGAARTSLEGPQDPLAMFGSVVGSASIFAMIIVVGPTLALIFPTGRFLGPRWRAAWLVLVAATAIGIVGSFLRPGSLNEGLSTNPFGVDAAWATTVAGAAAGIASLGAPIGLLLALLAVVVRYRRAVGVERQQMSWYVAASVVLAVLFTGAVLDGATGFTPVDFLAISAFALPAIAIGVAVLRYRLYDLDRIISRTIGWAIVTVILGAVFGAGVIALQALLPGEMQGETLAVAASTLLAFALFQPVRRRVQRAVDRQFDRARYDGERLVAAFGERLRDRVDLDGLDGEIRATVGAALRPAHASVWIRTVVE